MDLELINLIHFFLEEGANISSILVAVSLALLLKTFHKRGQKIQSLEDGFMPEFYEVYRNINSIFGNTNEIKEYVKELETIREEIRKINRKVADINDTINDDDDNC